ADFAFALGGVDHGHADAVLDRPDRIEALELGNHGGLGVGHDPAQTHERRMADALRDLIVNLAAERLRKRHEKSLLLTVLQHPNIGPHYTAARISWRVGITFV